MTLLAKLIAEARAERECPGPCEAGWRYLRPDGLLTPVCRVCLLGSRP